MEGEHGSIEEWFQYHEAPHSYADNVIIMAMGLMLG